MTSKNMAREKIVVSGVGCGLVDLIYNNIDFTGEGIRPFLSVHRGDGGLSPGHLVFYEEFVRFAGIPFGEVLKKITGGRAPDEQNIGGPSLVSLIHAAQVTDPDSCEVRYYGRGGNDEAGIYLLHALQKTPVVLHDYRLTGSITPSTVVLSDPDYDNHHGERMFVNTIGAAWDYKPEEIDDDFFQSDIVVFGGTALVPSIHDSLTELLRKANGNGCLTIVNTVFDFRNEKIHRGQRWPLGASDESYRFTDLLIADKEEALRLSGENSIAGAIRFFRSQQLPALIITNGSKPVSLYAEGGKFKHQELIEMPVSKKVTDELKHRKTGDTTGCGDNFAGGVIASLVGQMHSGKKTPDLREACCWGIVSGGDACFYMGGTYLEHAPGEKLSRIKAYYQEYKHQVDGI